MRVVLVGLLLLVACGGPPSEDEQACDSYGETVSAAEAGTISDDELEERLEVAWDQAESERLQDLLDDLMIGLEEDGEVDQSAVNGIRTWCDLG